MILKMQKLLDTNLFLLFKKLINSYYNIIFIAFIALLSWVLGDARIALYSYAFLSLFYAIFSSDSKHLMTLVIFSMVSNRVKLIESAIPIYYFICIGIYIFSLIILFLKKYFISGGINLNIGMIGKSFLIILISLCASQLVASFGLNSKYNFDSWMAIIYAFLFFFGYLIFNILNDYKNKDYLPKVFAIFALLILLEIVLGLLFKFASPNKPMVGAYLGWGNRNVACIFLELSSPFIIYLLLKNKYHFEYLALIMLIGFYIVLSNSRGGQITFFIILILSLFLTIYLLKTDRKVFAIIILSSFLTFMILVLTVPQLREGLSRLFEHGSDYNGRVPFWDEITAFLSVSPLNALFGGGVNFLYKLNENFGLPGNSIWLCHNTLMTSFALTGLVGATALAFNIYELVTSAYKNIDDDLKYYVFLFLLAGLIHGLVDNTFYSPSFYVLCFFIYSSFSPNNKLDVKIYKNNIQ